MIEIEAEKCLMLNSAETLPMMPFTKAHIADEVRHRFRYMDLRRPELRRNLEVRALVTSTARNYFEENGFTDVETPTLFRSTPEGAREFLVPTRVHGKFYALVQSPQQYKQLLMAAGIDRYYQIARCYRDEGGRFDRQPEFTQIDVEMSFADTADVQMLIEGLVQRVFKAVLDVDVAVPFPRMSFQDAIAKYGSDKPDIGLGMPIKQLESSAGHPVSAFLAKGFAPLSAKEEERLYVDALGPNETSRSVIAVRMEADGAARFSGRAKSLPPEVLQQLPTLLGASPDDIVFVEPGPSVVRGGFTAIGRIRKQVGAVLKQRGLIAPDVSWDPFWVVDFPLFREREELLQGDGIVEAVHHPFTSPLNVAEAVAALDTGDAQPLLQLVSKHYDLVLRGHEIGGGSIRIHDPTVQRRILEATVGDPAIVQDRFGHLLEGLSLGCPPHGGIALGLDRFVALLVGTTNIRDVIAFPKSIAGNDTMVAAPSAVDDKQLAEYHLQLMHKK